MLGSCRTPIRNAFSGGIVFDTDKSGRPNSITFFFRKCCAAMFCDRGSANLSTPCCGL